MRIVESVYVSGRSIRLCREQTDLDLGNDSRDKTWLLSLRYWPHSETSGWFNIVTQTITHQLDWGRYAGDCERLIGENHRPSVKKLGKGRRKLMKAMQIKQKDRLLTAKSNLCMWSNRNRRDNCLQNKNGKRYLGMLLLGVSCNLHKRTRRTTVGNYPSNPMLSQMEKVESKDSCFPNRT